MKKLNILVILLLISIISMVKVYADDTKVWNGYSIYNLNGAAVEVDSETRSCTIYGSRISSVITYTVRNGSKDEITAIMSLPVNNIDSVSVSDNGKDLKLRSRSLQSIRNTYNIDGLLPQATTWYSFTIYLGAEESHTLQVKTEEILQLNEDDTYSLAFFKDKGNASVISGKNIQFKAEFSDYRPYNIVDTDGLQYSDLSSSGIINLNMKSDAVSSFTIKYQPVEKMILDKLSLSKYKKPKAIATAYRSMDYATAATLCDEYIELPQDKQLNTEQVKLIKAESLRKQNKNTEYMDMIKSIDISSIYPARAKYKIMLDKLNLYKNGKNDEEYKQLLTQMDNETKDSYEFMNNWLTANGYIVKADNTVTEPGKDTSAKPDNTVKKKSWLATFAGNILKRIGSIRIDVAVAVILSFILGFLVGKMSNRRNGRRRGGSTYLFRN